MVRTHQHANFRKFLSCVLYMIAPKWGKSTECDWNLINSKGSQDTSACQILGYSFHALSWKCAETPNLTSFFIFFCRVWPWYFTDYLEKVVCCFIHPTSWMFSVDYMKFKGKLEEMLLQENVTDRHGVFIKLLSAAINNVYNFVVNSLRPSDAYILIANMLTRSEAVMI